MAMVDGPAVQEAPVSGEQVQVQLVTWVGLGSVRVAPVTLSGPLFLTSIVYVTVPPDV